MTAVASPPTLPQHNRPAWGINGMNGSHGGQVQYPEDLNRMWMPRKSLQRNNSSSSISSNSSTSSTSTVATSNSQPNGGPVSAAGDMSSWPNGGIAQRKRPQGKAPWPSSKPEAQPDFVRMAAGRPQLLGGLNGSTPMHAPSPIVPSQGQIAASQQSMPRPITDSIPPTSQPVLYLLSLNGTFERKTISVPFNPDTLRIGRQTNAKTVPTPVNGFFDSKVLSRAHAEIWSDKNGKIWIRDVRSSNGTFVNGTRLSQENRESEPHELQTGDHLELGIDIVSEDQKTVVHHKVAAKVEHAGFLSTSNNLLDVTFGDLDPNMGMVMINGTPSAVPLRQRAGSQASMASNGRMIQNGAMMGPQPNGMGPQRGFFFSPISTEQIVKRLQNEMRSARLQSQDLNRTGHFIQALISNKEEVKDIEKPEVAEPPKPNVVNGNGIPFRTDTKPRFSDPPAPPPQQPLPEKPDVPSLKRGITERPKTHAQSISPIRQDGNVSQILHLTDALNNARREIETQHTRMRDLEQMLRKEREARELAEELARRLEDSAAAAAKTNGAPAKPNPEETALEAAFEPPTDEVQPPAAELTNGVASSPTAPDAEVVGASANHLHAQLETMVSEMRDLRQQLEVYKQRAENAEAERDSDRKSLAEMALQIRRQEEIRESEARDKPLTALQAARRPSSTEKTAGTNKATETPGAQSNAGWARSGSIGEHPTLSRSSTITQDSVSTTKLSRDQALAHTIPYASVIGVVILGMGLMAYINGWQPEARVER
ncbi:hypothetical protein F4780DRAFT_749586 [Xylariomycetidae sp. FL0641]|nr:hypothetical protein F4780DRAFT_749586 [Xylariomycetidae sp. FL0641]